MNLNDIDPDYHRKNNVSEDNRIVIEDSILTGLNKLPQKEWYKITNISDISGHLLLESELKWNCLPMSTMGETDQPIDKYPLDMRRANIKIADIVDELLKYVKFYITSIVSKDIDISINKNILRVSTDKMTRNEIINLVIRFDNQLKLFKSNIINSDNGVLMLNQISKELLDKYEFSIFSDKDSQINIKLDLYQDKLNTLKVKPINSDIDENSVVYSGLHFKNIDLSQKERIKDITQKIENARSRKIKKLKASQQSEYNQKLAEFIENSSNAMFEKISEIGDIAVLYDKNEQKIKYLNLADMSIAKKLTDDEIDLSDDEFLLVINHVKNMNITVPSDKSFRKVLDKEKQFYKDYTKGTKNSNKGR